MRGKCHPLTRYFLYTRILRRVELQELMKHGWHSESIPHNLKLQTTIIGIILLHPVPAQWAIVFIKMGNHSRNMVSPSSKLMTDNFGMAPKRRLTTASKLLSVVVATVIRIYMTIIISSTVTYGLQTTEW